MRIIKIITPSNECLNIEFNSKENEIRDLISMLTNIPPEQIILYHMPLTLLQ